MQDVESLMKSAMAEIERLLSNKTVVGEPIHINGQTIIPLSSIGFGFGAGGGVGKGEMKQKVDATGSGIGGGGGIKPVAIIIIDKDGVRLEPIKGATATFLENLGEVAKKAFAKNEPDTSTAGK